MSNIIAITGGKGGTGKSTISTSLAYQLSKNKKVLLVDADVDCPNDHLLLDIDRKEIKTIYQRIPEFDFSKCTKCGKCGTSCRTNAIVSVKFKEPIFIPDQCNGCGSCKLVCLEKAISWNKKKIGILYEGNKDNLSFLSGELKINQPVSEFIVNHLNEKIEEVYEKYDYVIIDTAAGTHCPVIAAFEKADNIIAVTEPTPLGVHDLKIILELVKKIGKKASVIINRSDVADSNFIEKEISKFDSEIIFEVPYSKRIVNSYSEGKPIIIENLVSVVKK